MPSPELSADVLEVRLAHRGVRDLRRLTGGASSLTFAATDDDGARIVIKVAPPGLPPVEHRDVLRQARVMRALRNTAVAVPEVRWEDPGDPPDVPPLFAMAFVEGSSHEPLFDIDGDEDPSVVGTRLANAARTMGALHEIDPRTVGLDRERGVDVYEEIERWCRLLETVDPALAPGWRVVADELVAARVDFSGGLVVHGDFRLGNLLATGPNITAVIDWEIWSISDARIDLGWFLVNADPQTYWRRTPYVGTLPSPTELYEIYADTRGRRPGDVSFFKALACFKSAATWSLIVKHNRRRAEPDLDIEAMVHILPHLIKRARELLQ